MSYNQLQKPRFYTNSVESFYNKGFIDFVNIPTNSISDAIDNSTFWKNSLPIFLSGSWHNQKSYHLSESGDADGYKDIDNERHYYKTFNFYLNSGSLLNDWNYIMILGHNFHSQDITFRTYMHDEPNTSALSSVGHHTIERALNTVHMGNSSDYQQFAVPDHDYVPIIIEFEPDTSSINAMTASQCKFVQIRCWSTTIQEPTISISGISIGNYYDLPYNPDLEIKKTISYDGVNTYDTISGKTLSSDHGSSKPFNPFINIFDDYPNTYDDTLFYDPVYIQLSSFHERSIPTGRRSYDISYSYIGSNPSSGISYTGVDSDQNYLFPRDQNYSLDLNNDVFGNTYYQDTNITHAKFNKNKANLYTSVINKTMGSHIPFIFSLNGSNPNDLMLSRFTNDNFDFTEVAPSVHNTSFGIREVW